MSYHCFGLCCNFSHFLLSTVGALRIWCATHTSLLYSVVMAGRGHPERPVLEAGILQSLKTDLCFGVFFPPHIGYTIISEV